MNSESLLGLIAYKILGKSHMKARVTWIIIDLEVITQRLGGTIKIKFNNHEIFMWGFSVSRSVPRVQINYWVVFSYSSP